MWQRLSRHRCYGDSALSPRRRSAVARMSTAAKDARPLSERVRWTPACRGAWLAHVVVRGTLPDDTSSPRTGLRRRKAGACWCRIVVPLLMMGARGSRLARAGRTRR